MKRENVLEKIVKKQPMIIIMRDSRNSLGDINIDFEVRC